MKLTSTLLVATGFFAAAISLVQPSQAATFGWSGSGAGPGSGPNTAWLTTGGVNWTNLAFPGSADLVFFGAAGSGTSIGFNFNGPPAAGSTNLGAIVLGGGSTVDRTIGNSSGTASIATRLYLSGIGGGLITNAVSGRTLTLAPYAGGSLVAMTNVLVNSGVIEAVGNIVISANIIEAGGARDITKTGTGTLTLSGTNAQTGKMFVNAGTLAIGTEENRLGTNPAAASTDTLTLNGGRLQITAAVTIDDANRGITLGANHGTFVPNSGITLTVSRPITGAGNLTNDGAGTTILNVANSYTGRTVIRQGTVRVINGSGFGALPGAYVADQIILDGGGILNQDSEFALEANRGITVAAGGGRLIAGFARSWAVNSIIAGSGVLTIGGDVTPNVIYLNAANTHTGDLIVNNNTGGASWALVAIQGSLASGGLVRVTTNGWLLGSGTINRSVIATNGATLNPGLMGVAGTLTVNGAVSLTNTILNPDLANPATVGSGVNDLLQINGDLNLSGAVTVRPGALLGTLLPGTYRLINYTGVLTGGAANLVADASGYTVTFDTSVPGQVNMTVSGSPTAVVWKGDAGPLNAPIWDVANLPNFAVGVTPSTFLQGQSVLFDNTGLYLAAGQPLTFNMVGPSQHFNSLFPASVTVDTTNIFTINNTGTAGKLSGPMSFTKRGSGVVTLATANGNFPNDYTGPTIVEGGILRAGYARAFGATNGPTIATGGGTIDVNGQSMGTEPFVISGAGVTNSGALVNLGGAQNNALRYLTLAGDATVGGVGRWDVRDYTANNLTGAKVTGGGYSLIKTGANQVSFVNVGDTDLGNVTIEQGILGIELTTTLGRLANPLTIKRGATLLHWASSVAHQKPTRLEDGGRILKDNGNAFNSAPVTLLGGFGIFDIANNSGNLYIQSNRLEGAGSVAKTGAGILQLVTNNSHTGSTTVSNGTLQLLVNATIDNSSLIDVKSGAVLDVTSKAGLNGLTLQSGQTLTGAGSVVGSIIAATGSSITPGTSPGTLSVSSNLTLNGTTVTMELNGAVTEGAGINDLLTARDIVLGGPTTVRIVPLAALNTASPYVLARYTNLLTGNPLNISIVSDSRYTFTPDFGAANLIRVTASGAAANLVWAGGTLGSETLWNLNTTPNWLNGGPADTFRQGDAVSFTDGSVFNNVSLIGSLSPGTITANSAQDYTFSGAGELKTLSTINKSGAGRLTLANNNPELNGGATINNGALQIGAGGTSGGIGANSQITNNATLAYSRSDSNGLPNVIRGTGGFVKEGSGILSLAGANLFTGPVTVNNGTLRLGNAGAFGSTVGITVNNGGQVDLAGVTPTVRSNNYFLAGRGPDGRGALINSGISVSGNSGITNVTLTAAATIGAFGPDSASFGRFDIGSGANPLTSLLNANNFTLTKVGPGSVNLRVPSVNFPTLVVSNGVVYGENLDFNLATNIFVYSGGQIGMFGATYRTNSSSLTLGEGATIVNVGGSGTNVWTGPVTNFGAANMNVTGLSGNGHIQFLNNLYGSSAINVIGGNARAIELRANNDATFSGPWAVAINTILRTADGGTPGSGTITNLGTIEWYTVNPATLAQDIIGSPISGVIRHLTNSGALTLSGDVVQNTIVAQNGDLTRPLTFASGANVQALNITVGLTNFGPAIGSARLNIDAGALVTVGNLFLGDQNTQTGVVVQAGTVLVTNHLRVAHWPNAVSTYNMNGGSLVLPATPAAQVNQAGATEQNGVLYIGIDGIGLFTQTAGDLSANGIVLDARGSSVLAGAPPHTYALEGGTVTLGNNGFKSGTTDANQNYNIYLGGGTVGASLSWTSVLRMTLTGTNGSATVNPGVRTIGLNGVVSGPGGLVKEGSGTLFMTNALNNIGGTVRVNNGTLHGNGILGGTLEVAGGGTFSPGASPGVAIVTNADLAGITLMEISRAGTVLTNDRLLVVDTMNYGGTLVVTNIGQSLIGGEVFDLFDVNFVSGTFSSISLPALVSNLSWDISQLYVDGTIRVIGTPTIVTAPLSQVVYENDIVRFTAAATNMAPFTMQWMKDGIDIPGATGTSLNLTNVQLSDAGTYTFAASNSFGGTLASATLTVRAVTNLQAGLIAYWPMDDFESVNNRTLDTTANLQHLGGIGIQASNVIAGVRSNAFNFNGAASNFVARIHTGGEALPAYNYPACTVAMWVKGSYVGQSDRRVFVESSTNNNNPLFGLGTHTGGTGPEVDLYIRNNDGGNPVNHLRGRLPAFDGNWHHIAFVDNNGNTTLYVDGILDTNINYARGTMTLNAVSLSGLLRATYGIGFIGSIDDTMVWRRALKASEVACVVTNSLNGPPVITQQPVGLTVECSSNATFTVAGTSLDTIRYQWYLGGSPISGATAATLAFATTATSPGDYSVVLSNCVGAVTSAVVVLTVQDTIAPAITCPANILVQCDGNVPAVNLLSVTVSDACDANPVVTHVSDVASGACPKLIVRTYRATDASGNTNDCAQTITVHDTIQPSITCPPGLAVQCDSLVPAANFAGGSASDNCTPMPVVMHVSDVASGVCPRVIIRTYRATDACGNTNDCAQTITVHDTTPPSITCGPIAAVQCDADVPVPSFAGGTVSDNCDPNPTVVHLGDVASGTCPKIITRTWRATDACGNTNDCAQTITVHDTIAPTVTICPTNRVLSVDGSCQGLVPDLRGELMATDNCGGTVTISQSPAPGSANGLGSLTVTLYAVDGCDNTNSCAAIITFADQTAPSIIACATNNIVASDTNGMAMIPDLTVQVTATDDCGPITITQSPTAGTVVALGTYPVVLTVSDGATNLTTCSASVTVIQGGIAPSITTEPADANVTCGDTVSFMVSAEGTAPLQYQWYLAGSPVSGATSATLALSAVEPPQAGAYTVIITNGFGSITSRVATLTVAATPPVITSQPQSRTNNIGTTALFSVLVDSCPAATFQWCYDGSALAGEVASTLSVANVQLGDAGNYSVKISNSQGSVTSLVAVLTVNTPPVAQNNGSATTEGQSLAIAVAKLLANDSDADGDPISVVSVTATSTNGGSVVLGGGKVTYTRLPGFTGYDRYSYTISDGRGGMATADVEILVLSGNLPSQNQVSLTPTANGFLIRFAGIPGYGYHVQRAASVTGPWTTISTQPAPLHGIIEFEDMNPPPGSAFYRTVAQ